MSLPSIVSYGAAAKTSSLVWDGDLVIPDGYSIESASGEVGIVGDVSVSGNTNISGNTIINGDTNIAGKITHPIYPTTATDTDKSAPSDPIVLTTTTVDKELVLWGYKGHGFLRSASGGAEGTVTLTGINLDTGAYETQTLNYPDYVSLNIFVIYIDGGICKLSMKSPYNIIL